MRRRDEGLIVFFLILYYANAMHIGLSQKGFSIVEVLVVVVIIAILATIVYNSFGSSREATYFNRAKAELTTLANATKLYAIKYNTYPADVNRGLPSGIQEFVSQTDQNAIWPAGPWPGSVYDYDHWNINGVDTVQISIRFCPIGGPLSQCQFPQEPWASNFGVDSAVYYCLIGNCRAHSNEPVTYPGYCINCPGNRPIGT